MHDREKVIKGLECCHSYGMCDDEGCPYYHAVGCLESLRKDALSLLKEQEEQIKNRDESLKKAREEIKWLREMLKEQEAKTGKWILEDEDANSWECSECGGLLLINDGTPHENDWYFCPYCGSKLEEQAVK